MSAEAQSLRNVSLSGGIFTENILLKLRDHPEQLEIGKIDENLESIKREDFSKNENEIRNILEDLRETWFKISESVEKLSREQMQDTWLYPFFLCLGFQLEDYQEPRSSEQEDDLDALSRFSVTHQASGHQNPLFHLVPFLDGFDSSIEDNPSKKSHHDACQVFINRVQGSNWVILTNGRLIRLLTKYYHSYSRGYVEFNIENILTKKDEKEFLLLYRMIQASRFTPVQEEKSLIDAFQELSAEQGVKIGEDLRNNVHDVLELLGDELIHQNKQLLDDLLNGLVKIESFYHELLQVLYRVIFILYAEKREMFPDASSLFYKQFSISALRLQAEKPIKRDLNGDLWNKLFLLFKMIKEGNAFLDVNAFNGNLFDESNHPTINTYKLKLSNDALLKVIRELTTAKIGNYRQRINFLEVSVEEIGSIYESLLDYQPRFENDKFFLYISEEARKNSGSYYTNKDVVRLMIEKTIVPYVENFIHKQELSTEDKTNRLLDIKVCDPACGGGSFLIGALDLLGKILAQLRTGEEEPPKAILELSRRDVLENCIYGVDLNPFAVELTKLSLWIHACVKDKPLNFLDHHIKGGNSLIGTNIKRFFQKKREKARQTSLFEELDYLAILKQEFLRLKEINDNSVINVREKQQRFYEIIGSPIYEKSKRIADLFTFQVYNSGKIPENFDFQAYNIINIPDNEWSIREPAENELEVMRIAREKHFFHWDLEFPEVFFRNNPGFDIVIGNPPYLNISKINDDDIKYLKTYKSAFRRFDSFVLFGEKALKILRKDGFHAFIVPDKILTETYAKAFRKYVFENCHWNLFIDLTEINVFPAAAVSSIIYIIENASLKDTSTVIYCYGKNQIKRTESWEIKTKDFLSIPELRINLNWKKEIADIISKILDKGIKASKILYVSVGVQPGNRDNFVFIGTPPECKNKTTKCVPKYCQNIDQEICFPSFRGENITAFLPEYKNEHLHYIPDKLHRPAFPELFTNQKLMFRKVTGEQGLICAIDNEHFFTDDSLFCAISKYRFKSMDSAFLSRRGIKFDEKIRKLGESEDDDEKSYDRNLVIYFDDFIISKIISLEYLCAIFNSRVYSFYYKNYIGGGLNVFPEHIRNLNVPDFGLSELIQKDPEKWKEWDEEYFLKEKENEFNQFKMNIEAILANKTSLMVFIENLDKILNQNYENLIIQYFIHIISILITEKLKILQDSRREIIKTIEGNEGQKESNKILKLKEGNIFLKKSNLAKYVDSESKRYDIFDALLWEKQDFLDVIKLFKPKKDAGPYFEEIYDKYHNAFKDATDSVHKLKTIIEEILYRIFSFSEAEKELIKKNT